MFDSPITSIKRDMFIRTTPERVWKALTIAEELNRWETQSASIDLRIGGKVELDYGWGVLTSTTVKEFEVSKRLVLEEENGDLTIWTLEEVDGGTLVTLEYTGIWAGEDGFMMVEDMAFGTEQFFRNMKSVLEEDHDLRSTFWTSWVGVRHHTHLGQGTQGSIVCGITEGTPACSIIQEGDIIVRVNERTVESYNDFEEIVSMTPPGQSIAVTVHRDGEQHVLHVTTVPFGEKSPS
ncbi:SRPBCC domain-containing protein [Paenibacillus sp. N1-5-1-14]|uniref:SRPBCC domain-containing protein n=1 Tax=Paenibacillus radicibacter TaxID=2972488 RepID=UPI002159189F|nr:SRPBCC domain-containing protein [Paenibacillus radicibacter]MCR8643775.1 SRPBCC domain-containing protein [Paenibacillus radicibacter]